MLMRPEVYGGGIAALDCMDALLPNPDQDGEEVYRTKIDGRPSRMSAPGWEQPAFVNERSLL